MGGGAGARHPLPAFRGRRRAPRRSARRCIEVSIGDYVLSGGEIAALAVLDACVRLIPGVMGKIESGQAESFEDGRLEYPQYTQARANGRAGRSPKCCCPATTPASRAGGAMRRSASPASDGRTCERRVGDRWTSTSARGRRFAASAAAEERLHLVAPAPPAAPSRRNGRPSASRVQRRMSVNALFRDRARRPQHLLRKLRVADRRRRRPLDRDRPFAAAAVSNRDRTTSRWRR